MPTKAQLAKQKRKLLYEAKQTWMKEALANIEGHPVITSTTGDCDTSNVGSGIGIGDPSVHNTSPVSNLSGSRFIGNNDGQQQLSENDLFKTSEHQTDEAVLVNRSGHPVVGQHVRNEVLENVTEYMDQVQISSGKRTRTRINASVSSVEKELGPTPRKKIGRPKKVTTGRRSNVSEGSGSESSREPLPNSTNNSGQTESRSSGQIMPPPIVENVQDKVVMTQQAEIPEVSISELSLMTRQDVEDLEKIPLFGRQPLGMDESSFFAAMCFASKSSNLNAIVVHPNFTECLFERLVPDQSAMINAYGIVDEWDVLVFPVRPTTAHWTSLYYVRGSYEAQYYESMPDRPGLSAEVETRLRSGIAEYEGPEFNVNELRITRVPAEDINWQIDGWNCGFHAVLNMESRLINGNIRTRIPNFDIVMERQRWLRMLRGLLDNGQPVYEARSEALNAVNLQELEDEDFIFPADCEGFDLNEEVRAQEEVDFGHNLENNESDISESVSMNLRPQRAAAIRGNQRRRDSMNQSPSIRTRTGVRNRKRNNCRFREEIHTVVDEYQRCQFTHHPTVGCAAKTAYHYPEYFDCGDPGDCVCGHCEALLYIGETSAFCCANGQCKCPLMPPVEEPLKSLFKGERPEVRDLNRDFVSWQSVKNFRRVSNRYNKLLTMASCYATRQQAPPGGPQAVLLNGDWNLNMFDLECAPHQSPALCQIYMLDTEQALESMRNNQIYASNLIDDSILNLLQDYFRKVNPLVQDIMTVREMYQHQIAANPDRSVVHYRITFLNERQVPDHVHDPHAQHPRVFNVPQVNTETAAIWCSADGEPPENHGFWLTNRQGGQTRILPLTANADPFAFIVLFPRGTRGYHFGIKKSKVTSADLDRALHRAVELEEQYANERTAERQARNITRVNRAVDMMRSIANRVERRNAQKALHIAQLGDALEDGLLSEGSYNNVSASQFYLYYMQMRGSVHADHFLWGKGPLAQEFLIYVYFKIEQNRSDFWRNSIGDLRRTMASEMIEYLRRNLQPNQRLGKVFIMPKTCKGSRSYMQSLYSDIRAIEREKGKATFFVTMTMNPKCPEVMRCLEKGEDPINRPDIIERVFNLKVRIFTHLVENGVLGKHVWHVWIKEWQGRGNPHIHMLLCVDIPNNAETIDQYISAEIPEMPRDDDNCEAAVAIRRIIQLVTDNMLHKCMIGRCIVEGRCKQGFPKRYSNNTVLYNDRPHLYKRRSPQHGGTTVVKKYGNQRVIVDNASVIPYNAFLLLKMACHINIEFVYGDKAAKYGTKGAAEYLTKGRPNFYVSLERGTSAPGEIQTVDYDEYVHFKKATYIGACQAFTGITNYHICHKSHTVYGLPIHEPGQEPIFFAPGQEEEAAERVLEGRGRKSELQGFFDLCTEDANARQYTYLQLPKYYWFHKGPRIWKKRAARADGTVVEANVVVHIYLAPPRRIQLFAIRLLLLHVSGPKSFKELRTVNGREYADFVAAARARGLLADDDIWLRTMFEAGWMLQNPRRMRSFFVQTIIHGRPDSPLNLWNEFEATMYVYTDNEIEKLRRKNRALFLINYMLQEQAGLTNAMCGLPMPLNQFGVPMAALSNTDMVRQYYFPGERFENQDEIGEVAVPQPVDYYDTLNEDQLPIVNQIERALETVPTVENLELIPRLFGVSGSGGTGKTRVFNTLIGRCVRKGVCAIASATTGIAATLLYNGGTIHSSFGLGIRIDPRNPPEIEYQSLLGCRIRAAKIVLMDEMSMARVELFEAVENICRKTSEQGLRHFPFGGKVIVLGYDWKQLLPIVEHAYGPYVQVAASIQASALYPTFTQLRLTRNMRVGPGEEAFAAWLEATGKGLNMAQPTLECPDTDRIELPPEIIVFETLEELNAWIHYEEVNNERRLIEADRRCARATLAPLNEDVNASNRQMLSNIPSREYVFLSTDESTEEPNPMDLHLADNDIHTFNMHVAHNLPPHRLELTVGAVVILIRNVNIQMGLCNGTRMIVTDLTQELVECRIMTRESPMYGHTHLFNRFKFEYDDRVPNGSGLHFRRTQFPMKLAFTMSINRAQGATMERVGLALRTEVFAPGHMYTMMSRVSSFACIGVWAPHAPRVNGRVRLKNIVARGIQF